MGEGERARLAAWTRELRGVHQRLRQALTEARQGRSSADDLRLFCHGFCAALSEHHEGEDRDVFPRIAERHPELRDTLRALREDHAMIARLLAELPAAPPEHLARHLDGIAAIMESHFRFEERRLLDVLETAVAPADPDAVW
ncbi:hemerythrin domain-containing protein [Dactylosporangium sp. CA-139066]|uniref:hemerythrin domain-containing protein n=1 Tax=Dactylosporangium sp. CA-139066 TaxID=3239930 RepID=UPI003D940700